MLTYVITGSSRGLGLEFVKQLDNTVFACARFPERSEELQRLTDGKRVHGIQLDVTCEKSIQNAVDVITKHAFGGIDVLINNAAVCLSTNTIEKVKRRPSDIKKILNVSSSVGSITDTSSPSVAAYRISKSALNMTTRLQALHSKKENFIVFATHPGWVSTDMGGKNAAITPEQSVMGQLAKLESIIKEETGMFFDWKGRQMDY